MPPLYQNIAIRQLESTVIAQHCNTEKGLMELAGQAAFAVLQSRWPAAKKITVCCGKGNNAGDGFVLAKLAHLAGYKVEVLTLFAVENLSLTAKSAAQDCLQAGVEWTLFHPDYMPISDVIVDAILGTGLKGEVKEPFSQLIAAINLSDSDVLSLDTPSGIDVDTGCVLGCAVHAQITLTFIGLKLGLYTSQAVAHTGEILLADLNIPNQFFTQQQPSATLLEWQPLASYLPKRRRDTHKGHNGRVLVIGGDYGMGGAVRMAAEAALRAGAGLVSVATRPEHLNVVSGARPEIMCHQVAHADDLEPLIAVATVIVIGPGLGKSEWAQALLSAVLQSDLPKIIDADALNLLSNMAVKRDDWILTPHPGEASRLLGVPCQDLQMNRYNSSVQLQHQYGGVVVLKGAGSIIKCAEGLPKVCPLGNPGMATAGMGDVLSGIIGGLVGQGLDLNLAAEIGVLVHSKAADLAAADGGERGLLATDLLTYIRQLVNPDHND